MACGCCGQKYKQAAQQPVIQRVRSYRRPRAVNGIIKGGGAVTPPPATPPVEEVKVTDESDKPQT